MKVIREPAKLQLQGARHSQWPGGLHHGQIQLPHRRCFCASKFILLLPDENLPQTLQPRKSTDSFEAKSVGERGNRLPLNKKGKEFREQERWERDSEAEWGCDGSESVPEPNGSAPNDLPHELRLGSFLQQPNFPPKQEKRMIFSLLNHQILSRRDWDVSALRGGLNGSNFRRKGGGGSSGSFSFIGFFAWYSVDISSPDHSFDWQLYSWLR